MVEGAIHDSDQIGHRAGVLVFTWRRHDVRHAEHRGEVNATGQAVPIVQITQLRDHGGKTVVVDRDGLRGQALASGGQRHMATTDLEPHRLAHLGLPAPIGARQLDARREKPVIDRAHFDQHPRGADRAFRLAEARH